MAQHRLIKTSQQRYKLILLYITCINLLIINHFKTESIFSQQKNAHFFFVYLTFVVALYFITNYTLRKLKNLPPSPFLSLPIIGHLYLIKKPLYRSLSSISAKYGPVLLLNFGSRPILVVSSPSAAEECLSKHDLLFANRPPLLAGKYFGYNYTSLAWTSYNDHFKNLRRISSLEIFSSHRLNLLSCIRVEEVGSLVRRIYNETKGGNGGTVNMKSAFFELTLNVMMRMIAGKRYYGENVDEVEEVRNFHSIVKEGFKLNGTTNMGDYLPFLRWIDHGGMEKRIKASHLKRDAFMQSLVEEHRVKMAYKPDCSIDDGNKNKTLIEVLLKLQEKDPEYYQDEMIRALMLVLLVAGTDTSSGTMEWAMSLMLNNPEVLRKAQWEMDKIVGHDRLIEESDLANLPYLHCIITETLRMYPVGPLLPHRSSKECTVRGYRVPADTMLLVNVWAIHNDPNEWEEPRKFKPERFEGLNGDRDGFKFMPFGSGRRGCPGENLATRMVGLVLGSMIQCFDWERVDADLVNMDEGNALTLPKAQPLLAKCKPRSALVKLLSQI